MHRDNHYLIDSFYRWGSDGCVNLFYRPAGSLVLFEMNREILNFSAKQSKWIIQWKGNIHLDSGYTAYYFNSLAEARESFEELASHTACMRT